MSLIQRLKLIIHPSGCYCKSINTWLAWIFLLSAFDVSVSLPQITKVKLLTQTSYSSNNIVTLSNRHEMVWWMPLLEKLLFGVHEVDFQSCTNQYSYINQHIVTNPQKLMINSANSCFSGQQFCFHQPCFQLLQAAVLSEKALKKSYCTLPAQKQTADRQR